MAPPVGPLLAVGGQSGCEGLSVRKSQSSLSLLLELEVVSCFFVELDLSIESFSKVLLPLVVEEYLSLVEGEMERRQLLRGDEGSPWHGTGESLPWGCSTGGPR
jgi:hypothetical protein